MLLIRIECFSLWLLHPLWTLRASASFFEIPGGLLSIHFKRAMISRCFKFGPLAAIVLASRRVILGTPVGTLVLRQPKILSTWHGLMNGASKHVRSTAGSKLWRYQGIEINRVLSLSCPLSQRGVISAGLIILHGAWTFKVIDYLFGIDITTSTCSHSQIG